MACHTKPWLAPVVSGILISSQPTLPRGDLKHIEGDAWGGQVKTRRLVFDPADSLSLAASAHLFGKFSGIPCEVPKVSRLKSQWYAVTFYTNREWGRCN